MSIRNPVLNGHRKRDCAGAEFQPHGVHNNKRDPISNEHRKKYREWTEFGPSGCIYVNKTPYQMDIGKYTV